jgi:NAD(P)-dependent dehydrogenase (short-subunit alcohol dehydrogenase family)
VKIVILGASGGIGSAIAMECATRFPQADIIGTYHRHRPEWCQPRLEWTSLDVTDEKDYQKLSGNLSSIDWFINCVGFLHDDKQGPEKSIRSFEHDFFSKNMSLNTLPTLFSAQLLGPLLKNSTNAKFVTISAKVGSIEDNQLGGWYSYRASKAALNMVLKCLAIEWKRTNPQVTVLALHPGTTDTNLSKPFQTNVPLGRLFTPNAVANDLVNIIENSSTDQSGDFLSYSGERLPW